MGVLSQLDPYISSLSEILCPNRSPRSVQSQHPKRHTSRPIYVFVRHAPVNQCLTKDLLVESNRYLNPNPQR